MIFPFETRARFIQRGNFDRIRGAARRSVEDNSIQRKPTWSVGGIGKRTA